MYQREYKTCGDYPHVDYQDKNMNYYQPSLVSSFYKEESISCESGEPMVAYHDPIYMLFNQQRLSKLGAGAVEIWLQQMYQSKANPLAELRKECSDEDLVSMIKSRHLQSPSEILSWSRLMMSKMDEFKSEVVKLVASKEVEQPSQHEPNVEPKTE